MKSFKTVPLLYIFLETIKSRVISHLDSPGMGRRYTTEYITESIAVLGLGEPNNNTNTMHQLQHASILRWCCGDLHGEE